MVKNVTATFTINADVLEDFKKLCDEHYVHYSKLVSLLMDYAVHVDKDTNIIQLINKELNK